MNNIVSMELRPFNLSRYLWVVRCLSQNVANARKLSKRQPLVNARVMKGNIERGWTKSLLIKVLLYRQIHIQSDNCPT